MQGAAPDFPCWVRSCAIPDSAEHKEEENLTHWLSFEAEPMQQPTCYELYVYFTMFCQVLPYDIFLICNLLSEE